MRAALLLVLVACKADPNAEVCEHYAKLVVDCREDKSDSPGLVRDTAENFCLKGMSGKHEQIFGAGYKAMIECTRTATTCDAYNACQAP
ncbi:MAG: hypothetical protein H0T42_21500 [Deltaproteobacteria bacterium]|nr:hypothetical protein [Deltaproteobacteria bacterium]